MSPSQSSLDPASEAYDGSARTGRCYGTDKTSAKPCSWARSRTAAAASNAATHDVEDRIHDLPQWPFARPSCRMGWWHQRCDQIPFRIRHVGFVTQAFAVMVATSSWRPHQISPIRLRQPVGITAAPATQPLGGVDVAERMIRVDVESHKPRNPSKWNDGIEPMMLPPMSVGAGKQAGYEKCDTKFFSIHCRPDPKRSILDHAFLTQKPPAQKAVRIDVPSQPKPLPHRSRRTLRRPTIDDDVPAQRYPETYLR